METIDYDLSDNEQFEKLFDMSIHQGTIVTVDTADNKADVNIDGFGLKEDVEIFYHCEDGTTDAGASAFSIDDRVLVMNEKGKCDPVVGNLKIIGFVDELKSCSLFQFKLTRADGELVDESIIDYFLVYKSTGASVSFTQTYDAETEYWTIKPNAPFTPDPNGYWVEYHCTDGIPTQYPDKYKDADKKQVADLIPPGTYEGAIHYFITEDISPDIPEYSFPTGFCPAWPSEVSEDYFFHTESNSLTMKPGLNFVQKALNVKSSVPYRITRRVRAGFDGYVKPNAQFAGELNTISPSILLGQCQGPGDAWCAHDSLWDDGNQITRIQFTGGSLDVTIDYDTAATVSVSDINNSPSIVGIVDEIEVTNLTPGGKGWYCEDGLYPDETAAGALYASSYDKDVPRISAAWDF